MSRLLRLAKNIAVSNFSDLKYPYRFTYILTYKCQFKCAMCNIWQKPSGAELSLEDIKRFFEKSNWFSWINLSGGEIFLREDLPDIIEIILKNCRHLYLLDFPTNGFLMEAIVGTVKKILSFKKLPKLLVTVSLDGPQKLHEQIRNAPGSWERAVETFKRLRSLRSGNFEVYFGMTLQEANLNSFEETFKAAEEKVGSLQYSDFHVNLFQSSPHYYGNAKNTPVLSKAALRKQMDCIMKLRKPPLFSPVGFLERCYQNLAKIYLDKGVSPVPCAALSGSFFMDPCGNVYPCSIYDRSIGNITDFDYDILTLWCSNERCLTRQDIRKGNCPQCWTPCEAYQSILANLLPKFSRS